jgi:hypothetical protein
MFQKRKLGYPSTYFHLGSDLYTHFVIRHPGYFFENCSMIRSRTTSTSSLSCLFQEELEGLQGSASKKVKLRV